MSSKLTWRRAPVLLVLLALGGCTAKSMAPVVGRNDRVLDNRLVGHWQSENGKETALIMQSDSEYAITYKDENGKTAPLVGRLGRLGNRWVLDVAPDGAGLGDASDNYKGLLLPVHAALVIDSLGPSMTVALVKADSVEAFLKREPTAVAHLEVEDDLLLTAKTPELRAFLERFLKQPGVTETSVWTKK